MAIQQQNTATLTEATAPIVSATGATTNMDLASLWSQFVALQVARQIMVVGDPTSATGVGAVNALVSGGAEQAQIVRLAPGSFELQTVIEELRMLRAEMQQVVNTLGGITLTAPPLINSQQGGS